jgi:hypothetical protein
MTINLNTNKVPTAMIPLINLGRTAHAGAVTFGGPAGLQHNPASKIAINLYDVIGDPATPLIPGKKALYDAQVVAVGDAYAAKREAIADGRDFCRHAINLLRPILGNEWNTAWQAAGFHQPSLALPRQPAAMLSSLRAYFNAHAAHENSAAGITAVAAETAADAIDSAILSVATAKNLRVQYKAARDAALDALHDRLCGLRGELDQLLEDDDGRWYQFGFHRPADGKIPVPVTGLTLNPGGAGIVLVSWASSPLATNYRVTWKPSSSSDPVIDAGLFPGTECVLTDLPSTVPIIVAVSARNGAGETTQTEVSIVVP